jgi:hypothetical protein
VLDTDREFEANSAYVNIEDISYGREDVPISCVNCVDTELPLPIEYSKKRIALEGVPLNTDENLLEGCRCEDGNIESEKCSRLQSHTIFSCIVLCRLPKPLEVCLLAKNIRGNNIYL